MNFPDISYVDALGEDFWLVAQRQSQELWAEGKSFEERTARLRELLDFGGPQLLRVGGLLSSNARSGTELVCSFKRYGLQLKHAKLGLLNGFGFGAVFTPPPFRGQGLAARLVHETIRREKEAGSDFALLFSDIGYDYYAQFGFRPIVCDEWRIETGRLPSERAGMRCREASPADAEWIRDLYHRQCDRAERPYLWRSTKSWGFFRRRNATSADLVLEGEGGKAALNLSRRESVLHVKEVAADEVLANAVWRTVRAQAEAFGCTEVRGWQGPWVPEGAQISARKDELQMILPLNPALSAALERDTSVLVGPIDYF